jgi:hypothetical protein
MRSIRTLWPVLLFPVLLGLSCEEDGGEMGPPRAFLAARVLGNVTTRDGAPVPGATVRVTALAPTSQNSQLGSCSGSIVARATVTTNNAGLYQTLIQSGGSELEVCLAVEVSPPPALGLRPAVVSGRQVQLRATLPGSVLDDAVIDVQLE